MKNFRWSNSYTNKLSRPLNLKATYSKQRDDFILHWLKICLELRLKKSLLITSWLFFYQYRQNFLYRHNLHLVVLFDVPRHFKLDQTCVDLEDVLIQTVVRLYYFQASVICLLAQARF